MTRNINSCVMLNHKKKLTIIAIVIICLLTIIAFSLPVILIQIQKKYYPINIQHRRTAEHGP